MENTESLFDFTEEAAKFEVADTGVYELEITNAELKKSDSGKNYIGLAVEVREDVSQPFTGVRIFDNIWENEVHRNPLLKNKRIKKEDYDAMTPAQKQNIITRMEYDDYKIRVLVHAQDVDAEIVENGVKKPNPNFRTKFGSVAEIAQFLNGMCFQAKVLKYTDDKSGKERNSIDFKTIKRTSVPKVESADVSDDELPF